MIRAFEPSDEDELVQTWLASTIPGQPFVSEKQWRAMEPEIRALLPVAETWVVKKNGTLVAFMSLRGNLIGGLFTHPDHQGAGYGRALVEHARGRRDSLFVEVFEVNEKALGLYRRCGFVEDERRIDDRFGLAVLILRMETPAV